MNLLVIADEYSVAESLPGTRPDVLISCGDLYDSTILRCAEHYDCHQILAVKGNHDSPAPFPKEITDLNFNIVEVGGLVFGGFAGCWKYKPRGHYLFEQHEVTAKLKHFPAVDVFVAHNSPRGIHDREDDVHLGFDAFNEYIERAAPRLFLHGHQHLNIETMRGNTRLLGVFGAKALEL